MASIPQFEPVEFYSFASWLYKTRPSVASQSLKRTIIARAYYAALLSARDKTGLSTNGPNGHSDIIRELKRIDLIAGNNLSALNIARRGADYEYGAVFSEKDLIVSLRNARQILERLGLINKGDPACSVNYVDATKFC